MVALISLLVVVTISVIVVRIGGVALTMTGVSSELAFFQAQSAFSGVGFTTRESESVVRHPARRKIIRLLMLMGNAGITSAIASLVLTFYKGSGRDMAIRLGVVAGGLALLWLISRSKMVDRALTAAIKAALTRWTELEVHDYARLLEIGKGYTVSEIQVSPSDWLCNHKLRELALASEGVLVLGIRRANGNYIGAPSGETTVLCEDTLTCYGPERVLKKLASRLSGAEGDTEHARAVEDQKKARAKESNL